MNFTAKVTQSSGTTTPTGSVQFKIDGSNFGGPVGLSGGSATSQTTSSLGPGTHAVGATYMPSGNFTPSSASMTQTVNETGFDHVMTGMVRHPNMDGGSWLIKNAVVTGGVHISGGANVVIIKSTIFGGVRGIGGGSLEICGSNGLGGIRASGFTGPITIGDTDDSCAPNFVMGGVRLDANTGGVEVDNNAIRGGVTLTNNTVQTIFERNTGSGGAACTGNNPPATNAGHPNHMRGPQTGECKGL